MHTGQHYDAQLSDVFFTELKIPTPDVHLQVGSGSHAVQTGQIMVKFEEYLLQERKKGSPIQRVVVVGDVNSTLACTLVAAKLEIPVTHVEAGLRSFDRSMPEEINRLVTDSLSDQLLCSEPAGVENLRREGHPLERISLVGNVMIDTLLRFRDAALRRPKLNELGLLPQGFAIVTLHRPANVDNPDGLARLVKVLIEISAKLPLVFAVHPRTAERLKSFGLTDALSSGQILILPPQGYLDFLCLTAQARLILTDSGGLQEESTALAVPCLTMRPNTERPITLDEGTSTLIGSDLELLRILVDAIMDGEYRSGQCPALWDGKAGLRVAQELAKALGAKPRSIANPMRREDRIIQNARTLVNCRTLTPNQLAQFAAGNSAPFVEPPTQTCSSPFPKPSSCSPARRRSNRRPRTRSRAKSTARVC